MKRGPTSDINHTNWDKEDEKEERGQFITAEKNIISQRKVIQARRKPASTSTLNVFKSFTGFIEQEKPQFSFNSGDSEVNINKEKHLNSLKLLNQQFLECIQKHISENPFCVLTPTINDYNKNLLTIKEKYPLLSSEPTISQPQAQLSLPINSSITAPVFNFNVKDKVEASNKFVFGTKGSEASATITFPTQSPAEEKSIVNEPINVANNAPLFGFSINTQKSDSKATEFGFPLKAPNSDNKTIGFGFSSGSTLFGNGTNSALSTMAPKESVQEEEEEYVPPVAEVREVKEKDSVYDVRCKLYYQQQNEWKIRGVGNLFIKPLEKGKFQLVIRADNSLATILLNVLINDKIPLSVTKNNVSLVAMTDFLKEIKPTPLLIRVKNEEAAETLLEAMKNQL